jgi:DNA replication protein DnaC
MSLSDQNYGAGDPDCPICNGLGYIRYDVPAGHPMFGKIVDCECRESEAEAERQEYLRRVGGLEYLADKTFDTFESDKPGLAPMHQENLQRAHSRALEYAHNPEGWLLFTGEHGSGKTHLAAAIANEQIKSGQKALFMTAPDLLDLLRASFDQELAEDESFPARFEEVRKTPLLILDDLGVENQTPWAVEKLFQILNHRYTAQLPTVITTSHNLSDINEGIRTRLTDIELTEVLALTSGSSRLSDYFGGDIHGHLTFDTFQDRQDLPADVRDNLNRALQRARDFAERPDGWLVLLGTYGSGKTHLAAAIANYRMARSAHVLFVSVPDLLDHLRAAYAPDSASTYDERFQEVRKAPLLVLDDLGTESATPWAREKLDQLFSYRYNAELPTVITTSRSLEALEKSSPRLLTRLRDTRICTMFEIRAPAYIHSQRAQRK